MPMATSKGVAGLADGFAWSEEIGNSLVVREPVGVVAAVTPWNYPLHQVVAKLAPALVAGCTVVLKPSEVAPLTAGALAAISAEAGLPAGVFNVVHGTGPEAGEALAAHPGVDMVSFTGSVAAGRRVQEVAAGTVKRVALELGGKSANIVLDDADLTQAVKVGLGNCFINGGQTCTAWTRLLVPESLHDEVVEMAVSASAKYTVGDPTDDATRIGPMSSTTQRDRVASYIARGVEEGAELAVGGPGAPEGVPSEGAYVRPTIFAGVRPDMVIAQEEIFGPVLSVMPYGDVDEAVEIANATIYGLAGAVFAGSQERGIEVARRMRTGQVDVNGGAFNPLAPFGGYKQSGTGRELGRYGLEEFLEVKSIQL
jgi:aldehyde dehydrogenase (NAD+)